MKYLFSVFFLLFIVLGCENQEQKTEDIAEFNKLEWMQGVWTGQQGNAEIYESWTGKNYRIMEGISFTTKNDRRIYTQDMRLEQSNNKIFMIITPKDTEEEIVLNLEDASDSLVVFSNRDSVGYPQEIIYRRLHGKHMEVALYGRSPDDDTVRDYRKKQDL